MININKKFLLTAICFSTCGVGYSSGINLQFGESNKINSLSLDINNYSITSGADNNRDLRNTMSYKDKDGLKEVDFDIDRKSSEDVKGWLIGQLDIEKSETSENSIDDKLSVAFDSDLKFTLKTDDQKVRESSQYTFSDMYFGLEGRWIFGGNNCQGYGSGVICTGTYQDAPFSDVITKNMDFKEGRYGADINMPETQACFYNQSSSSTILSFTSNNHNYSEELSPFSSFCIETDKSMTLDNVRANSTLVANKILQTDINNNSSETTLADNENGWITSENHTNFIRLGGELAYNGSTWMSKLPDETTLNNIVMPGSHDAGMSETQHCSAVVETYQAKTQFHDILGQLNAGSRYFDIRPSFDNSDESFVTFHRHHINVGITSDDIGCDGQEIIKYSGFDSSSSSDILPQVNSFLESNPSETVLLKISHPRDTTNVDLLIKLIDEYKEKYPDRIYISSEGENIANTPLSKLRGKMVILFDQSMQDQASSIPDFISKYSDTEENSNSYNTSSNLTVYDHYSSSGDIKIVRPDQLEKYRSYAGLGQDSLFLLSWTLTVSSASIENTANDGVGYLPRTLEEMAEDGKKPNIVYIDFMNENIAQSIINMNFTN